jgi:hypothetical protein
MERKGGSNTVAVTAEEVKAALGKTRTLVSEEEKVLRMRHGVPAADPRAPLPRAAGGNEELQDELLLLEMQLLKAHRMHQAKVNPASAAKRPALDPSGARAKDKIVRALRKKK